MLRGPGHTLGLGGARGRCGFQLGCDHLDEISAERPENMNLQDG